ncbi:BZ3500_MvSof-1268-A1-R1_Chr10-2g02947 [Microbotryum saponariae]|uniref:BZ3500_MvSof-1268-A1-R1_Chr10-2g02947 protein n=1 Tax=Microbotryum saponariae TaxID=289078 RepID=A0A2X0N911_9BASI|nr:BZ3501_MvSof-1269-A2-R1_Chr10-2g02533 [Microbotryum saponariae]SDA01796.1 BZ3500_MvSof-1268-A1-R1_Chr10-2g02947 [Microbotryum saponariae]
MMLEGNKRELKYFENLTLPSAAEDEHHFDVHEGDGAAHLPSLQQIKKKLTTKEGWMGDYDFGFLCMPTLPFAVGRGRKRRARAVPFYALDQEMPILLALICGFQHALAMLAGLVTPPIIFANQLGFNPAQQNQAVAVSLIASGFLSAIQMSRFAIPFTKRKYWLGTGLITVVGTSFATLSTASAIFNTLYADGTSPSTVASGVTVRGYCPQAYGYLLGTSCLTSLLEMGMAFVPPKVLKRIFPPVVTGTVILLIGASLIGSVHVLLLSWRNDSGFLNWGGGSGNCHTRPETGFFALCPDISAPRAYQWGDPRFLGLGLLSFLTIIFLEFFGSPAMRSGSIILGLVVGCIVAGPLGYIDGSSITQAPVATFLWRETFPLKVHGPSILPLMAVYISLAMEATGDITASSEASRQPVTGPLFDSRVQGGILADGFNGLLSGLMMNAPVSIFAQNNGVISITRCANRTAGYFCAATLIVIGILAKISGIFLAIPAPVLGGVTTFLFASVAVSGFRVLSYMSFTRRDRMILASALSLGLGNLLVPDWSSYIFTSTTTKASLKGFENSLIIVGCPFTQTLSTSTLLTWCFLPLADLVDSFLDRWYHCIHPQRAPPC